MPTPRLHARELGALAPGHDMYRPLDWPAEQLASAIHGASHAVVAMGRGHRVTCATIWPNHAGPFYWEGRCAHHRVKVDGPLDYGTEGHVDTALIVAAPWAARDFMNGITRWEEARVYDWAPSDMRDFTETHRAMARDLTWREWERDCTAAARGILEANARSLEAVTLWLLLRGTATEDDLRRLAPDISTTWMQHTAPAPAPATYAPPVRLRGGSRADRPRRQMADVMPGLRYSDPAPLEARS